MSAGSDFVWCRTALERVLSDISSLLNVGTVPVGVLNVLEGQLELLYRGSAWLPVWKPVDCFEVHWTGIG